jgi:hypothetical protein
MIILAGHISVNGGQMVILAGHISADNGGLKIWSAIKHICSCQFNHILKKIVMKKVSIDFVPRTFGELLLWFYNLDQQITTAGPILGLTPAQITEIKDVSQDSMDLINTGEVKKNEYGQALAARDLIFSNQLQVVRRFVTLMKKSTSYTVALGEQLGITAGSKVVNTTQAKPVLQLSLEAGNVRIAFKKQHMPGISIFSRQRGGLNWVKIIQTSFSPFADLRSLSEAGKPEAREYMALFHDGYKEVGQESEIYSILTGTQASNV